MAMGCIAEGSKKNPSVYYDHLRYSRGFAVGAIEVRSLAQRHAFERD
jgi:hypothetical protein